MVVSHLSEIINDVELFEKTVLSDGTVEYLVRGTPFSFTEKNGLYKAHMNAGTFNYIVFDDIELIEHDTGLYFVLLSGGYPIGILHKSK